MFIGNSMSNPTANFLLYKKYHSIIFAMVLFFLPQSSNAIESRKIDKLIEGALSPIEKQNLIKEKQLFLKKGKTNYFKYCFHCHGSEGKGDGRVSKYINPQPRELSQGIFKFHSTNTNALPLDEDIINTIKSGIPGTAMPPWGSILSDEIIDSLVAYIKTFSDRFGMELPKRKIIIGVEPPFDGLSVAHGKKIYKELHCGKCHGENGEKEGELSKILKSFQGAKWFVYDLSRTAYYKRGSSGVDIYKTLTTGLDGSPMNAYDYISDFERWNLVHYLQSMHHAKRKIAFTEISKIKSKFIDKPITITLDESVWEKALEAKINLWPLRARKNPFKEILIRSVHNRDKIAIKLKWEDLTADGITNNNYVDQVAIQFAVNSSEIQDSPFYGMGEKGKIVNIWHWKADVRQKIFKSKKLKGKGVVEIPDSMKGMFVNPFTESSVEEMNSKGIGSLIVQPLVDQKLEGKGYWNNGYWNVVIIRNLNTLNKWDIDFSGKNQVVLAFALWDGDKKDMNSKKLVSFWNILKFP